VSTVRMAIPEGWYTAGSGVLWGRAGTYKLIPAEALPAIDEPLDGTFAWLRSAEMPASFGMTYGPNDACLDPPAKELVARAAEARREGLAVPPEFLAFMGDAELSSSVPSCTACFYDLGARLVAVPEHEGPERLLRFMNDQQSCLAWYLLLEPGGRHRVAVAPPHFRDEPTGDTFEDVADPRDVLVCAPSFEAFVRRFWIENAIWFWTNAGKTLPAELVAYVDAARSAAERGLVKRVPYE